MAEEQSVEKIIEEEKSIEDVTLAVEEKASADVSSAETGAPEAKPAETKKPAAAEKVKKPSAEKPKKRWYIVHAYSGKEKHVVTVLQEHIKDKHMEASFDEIIVPTEEVVELRAGQKRKSERKFFPGYVLVRMDMNDETWHLVRHIPYVLGFVGGTSDKPIPVSDEEIDAILQRVEEGAEQPKHKIVFEPGEIVRVIDGPFADFDGAVEEVNYEKNRLRVAVLIFGRSTPVELEFEQVQKI